MNVLKKKFRIATGKMADVREESDVPKAWFGNDYGGFFVAPDRLPDAPVVFSFGIGEDVSFDLAMIENLGASVYGFDPTPKSIDWVESQDLPREFEFAPFGIGPQNEQTTFFLPKNKDHVSGSVKAHANVDTHDAVDVEMRTFESLRELTGCEQVDLIKMDIEGAEYAILESIASLDVGVSQMCVEFHDRFLQKGEPRTEDMVEMMRKYGFIVFGVSPSHEEISFIRV